MSMFYFKFILVLENELLCIIGYNSLHAPL